MKRHNLNLQKGMCRPAVRQWGQLLHRDRQWTSVAHARSQKAALLFTNASELTAGPGEQTRSVPYSVGRSAISLSSHNICSKANTISKYHTHTLIMTYKHAQKLYRTELGWEKPETWLKICKWCLIAGLLTILSDVLHVWWRILAVCFS